MPAPSSALLTLRPDLAESFESFDLAMSWQGFIGQKIFPVIDVASQAGNFGVIPIEELLQQRDTKRAPGGGYSRATTKFTPKTYACQENGFEEPLDDREARMYANYFAAEQYAALRARDAVLRNYESRVITTVTSTANITNNGAVGTSWKTVASSDPVTDVIGAKKAVYAACGLNANTVVIGWNALQNVRQSANVINRLKYWGGDDPTTKGIDYRALARLFDVDNVVVAGAQKNTADQGQAATLGQLWDDNYVLVCRTATTQDFKEPCVGRTFHWPGDGSSIEGMVESYRDETVRANIYRVRMDTDENLLFSQAAYLLTGANA